jgi:hypothetical protein
MTYTNLAAYSAATANTTFVGFSGIFPPGRSFESFNHGRLGLALVYGQLFGGGAHCPPPVQHSIHQREVITPPLGPLTMPEMLPPQSAHNTDERKKKGTMTGAGRNLIA